MVQCVGWEYNDPSIVACWIRDCGISCNFWCKNTYKNDWNRGFARGISSKCPFAQVWQIWLINWFSTDTDLVVYLRYTSGKTSLWMILWTWSGAQTFPNLHDPHLWISDFWQKFPLVLCYSMEVILVAPLSKESLKPMCRPFRGAAPPRMLRSRQGESGSMTCGTHRS